MSDGTDPVRHPYRLRHRCDLPYPPRSTLIEEITDDSVQLRLWETKKLGHYLIMVNRAMYALKRNLPPDNYRETDEWKDLHNALVTLEVEKARRDYMAAYDIRQEFHRDPPRVMPEYTYPPWANEDSSSAASHSSGSSLEDGSPPTPPRDPNETEEDVPGDEPADGQ